MYKIVADSSCDLKEYADAPFTTVPLTLSTDEKTYVDETTLDVQELLDYMYSHKGRSYTSCPSTQCWLDSFEGADEIYAVTITSGLSGTFAGANVAKEQYLSDHPNTKICIVDSLSTGPGLGLLIEKIAALKNAGKTFEEVSTEIVEYQKSLKTLFILQSLHNLAVNGRVNKLVASAIGIMNIRIMGTASTAGTIEPIAKCRGDKKAVEKMLSEIRTCGYKGGKIRISHVNNEALANTIIEALRSEYGDIDICSIPTRGLDSYYAERGGIILGCER